MKKCPLCSDFMRLHYGPFGYSTYTRNAGTPIYYWQCSKCKKIEIVPQSQYKRIEKIIKKDREMEKLNANRT